MTEVCYINLEGSIIECDISSHPDIFPNLMVAQISESIYKKYAGVLDVNTNNIFRLEDRNCRILYVEKKYQCKKVKATKLAKKIHPKAIEEKGWLFI